MQQSILVRPSVFHGCPGFCPGKFRVQSDDRYDWRGDCRPDFLSERMLGIPVGSWLPVYLNNF